VTAPLVSVIMASYNSARFIPEALDSVLGQTYGDLELVVVDDCSSDGTLDILADYSARSSGRMRWIGKDQREGPCRARNDALDATQGLLVAWMDHDDLWQPTKIEEQVDLLRRRPDVGMVYTYFDAFDSDTGHPLPWRDAQRDFEGDVLAELLLTGCFIGSVTTMFRREAMARSGGRLRERDFSIGDDYYLWLVIALDWQTARIPRPLARYRRHSSNESARMSEELDIARWRVDLVAEFLMEFPEALDRLGRRERLALTAELLRPTRGDLRRGRFAGVGRDLRRAAHLLRGERRSPSVSEMRRP
jgi:glycosyltransferase involved in cell wall biosynthesis